jgi:hypothetical protein
MRMTLVIHIIGGGLGLLSGYVALYAAKGATLHRKSGIVFVYSMLTMSTFGALMAATQNNNWTPVNVSAALLTSYLVITARTTVRPFAVGSRWLHLGGLLLASTLALTDLTFGAQAMAAGGRRNGVPAFPFLMFGVVALLATAGDLRVMRSGVLQGASRLRRHLWRMTFALFIAAMSFFLGQAKVIPKPIRIPALLALPVVAVLVTMLYWLWRVRARRIAIEQPEAQLRAAA